VRRNLSLLIVSTVVSLVLPVMANEKPSEVYQKAEKDLNVAANNSLRGNLKDINYPGIQKDAESIQVALSVMLDYWKGKNVEDAVAFVQTGLKAAADLKTAAGAMDYQGVLTAQNALAGSNGLAFSGEALPGVCVGCHLAHRQRLPDGTFEIK